MSQEVIIYIIVVQILCFLIGFGIVKSFPKLGLKIPDKKSIFIAAIFGLVGTSIFILGMKFERFPPPKELANNYFEGKVSYVGSGRTPSYVGDIIVIDQKDGSKKTVECNKPTIEWLNKGAIPCGYSDIAHKIFTGQKGKVWYYNDMDYSNTIDGRYNTRYIATQVILDNGVEFPYSIQYYSILHSIKENTGLFTNGNIFLFLFLFSIFFFGLLIFRAKKIISEG